MSNQTMAEAFNDVYEGIKDLAFSFLMLFRIELTCKATPYQPDETGFTDTTKCECGELNDVSAVYCNKCGCRIEIVGW